MHLTHDNTTISLLVGFICMFNHRCLKSYCICSYKLVCIAVNFYALWCFNNLINMNYQAVHCKKVYVTLTIFGHLSCFPFVCMTRQVQGVLQFKQSIIEKLPSLVKLVFPFRKPINQHFWGSLLFL